MNITNNIIIPGSHGRPILTDIYYQKNNTPKPVILFCHGYKGFKDWGAWNQMGQEFAKNGFCFIKFNFSFNGGTIEQPIDFPDLEAFGNNNYTKELDDLDSAINWIYSNLSSNLDVDTTNITLLGHSRGGGIVTLKASEDPRISAVISLAGVSDFANRFPKGDDLKRWEKEGVRYVENGRTKQQMPHYYQFYQDFLKHKKRLDIKTAATSLKIPHLIIHGNDDTSVSIIEAQNLRKWSLNSELIIIAGANHVFGTQHPWKFKRLSKELKLVVKSILSFLNSNSK